MADLSESLAKPVLAVLGTYPEDAARLSLTEAPDVVPERGKS